MGSWSIEYSNRAQMFRDCQRRSDLNEDQLADRDRLLADWQRASEELKALRIDASKAVKVADEYTDVVNSAYTAYFEFLERITES